MFRSVIGGTDSGILIEPPSLLVTSMGYNLINNMQLSLAEARRILVAKPEEPKSYQTATPHSPPGITPRQAIASCPAVVEAGE
jgi:hypothetical protein